MLTVSATLFLQLKDKELKVLFLTEAQLCSRLANIFYTPVGCNIGCQFDYGSSTASSSSFRRVPVYNSNF